MEVQIASSRLAGAIIVLGSALFLAAATPGPNIYQLTDRSEVLAAIAQHRANWVIANAAFLSGAVLAAAGLGILALRLAEVEPRGLAWWAGAACVVGALFWAYFVVHRTVAPGAYFPYSGSLWVGWVYGILTLAGLGLFGVVFMRGGLPNWLGYVTLGFTALIALLIALMGNGLPPQVLYLPTLVIGITVWVRG